MTNYPFDITLKPIGTVKSEIQQPTRRDFKAIISEITIDVLEPKPPRAARR